MSIFQITKSDIIFPAKEEDLKHLCTQFNQRHCILLKNFIEPGLLEIIQHKINQSEFYEKKYKVDDEKVVDYKPLDKTINSLLRFLINDKKLFKLIEKITDGPRIGSFNGVTLRMTKDYGNHVTWHNDMGNNRLIGISINLSTDIYSGGIFQIRNYNSKQIIHEIANTGFGDCIVFSVSSRLEHRVTKVENKTSRTVFAGWFRSKPDYCLMLKKKPAQLKNEHKKTITISKLSPVVLKQEVLSHSTGKHMLIFNPDNGTSYKLDPVGKKILDLLEKPITPTEISNLLSNEYEIDPIRCKEDILKVLHQLLMNDLIVTCKK